MSKEIISGGREVLKSKPTIVAFKARMEEDVLLVTFHDGFEVSIARSTDFPEQLRVFVTGKDGSEITDFLVWAKAGEE